MPFFFKKKNFGNEFFFFDYIILWILPCNLFYKGNIKKREPKCRTWKTYGCLFNYVILFFTREHMVAFSKCRTWTLHDAHFLVVIWKKRKSLKNRQGERKLFAVPVSSHKKNIDIGVNKFYLTRVLSRWWLTFILLEKNRSRFKNIL
jgi:hypothetical protein